MDVGSFPEQVGPLEIIVKEEEDTNCSEAEGCPGQSCVSATEQGSVPDAGRQTKTESAERASGPKRVEDTLRPCYVRLELLPKPVAVVAPEKSKLKSRTTAALPKCDLPTGAEQPVEEKQFARAPSVKNRTGSRWQAVVPALAQSTTQMQDTRPTPLVVPPKKRKHYFCAWCKETFRLQINLEVHYRYCRRKQLQELGTVLKTEENPDGQGTSGSSSTGGASGPALLQQNAQHPPSEDRKGDLHCGPSQRRQGAVKTKDASDAGRGAAEGRSGLTATVSAMKKLCRCPECGERFVYKWQLAAHRGCKANVPPEPPDLAARAGPSRTETQEPSFALAEHPGTSKDAPLYSCRECGKNFSRHYLSTHRAFHEGLRYRCLWCGKVFHYQSGAKRHQRVHYKKGQKDTCPKCKENGCFCMVEKIHVASRSDDREEAGQKEPK